MDDCCEPHTVPQDVNIGETMEQPHSNGESMECPIDRFTLSPGRVLEIDGYGLYLDSRDKARELWEPYQKEIDDIPEQEADRRTALENELPTPRRLHTAKCVWAHEREMLNWLINAMNEGGVGLSYSEASWLYDSLEILQLRKKKARRDALRAEQKSLGFTISTLPD